MRGGEMKGGVRRKAEPGEEKSYHEKPYRGRSTGRRQVAGACSLCERGDKRIRSVASGRCEYCGEKLNCLSGCYRFADYSDDLRSAMALDQGICLVCGGKVDCPSGHLAARRSLTVEMLIKRADELWLS